MNPETERFTSEKLLEILSFSPHATAIYTGEDILIQSANSMMIKYWGKDKSIIGKPILEAIPELAGQPFIDILKTVWRTGNTYKAKDTPAELIVNCVRSVYYFDFTYQAIKNDRDEVVCILHTTTDVTELNRDRKLAAEAVKQKQAYDFEQALNEELAASNEELTASNEELAKVLEELRLSNLDLEKTKDTLQLLNEQLEKRIIDRLKTISSLNEELKTSNEEINAANEELAASNEELFATNEQLIQSREQIRDAIIELAESEYRTRSIIESAPFPIGVYSGLDMVIAFANQSIIDVWGKGNDVIGKRYSDILPELGNQSVFVQLEKVFVTGEVFEARNQRLDLIVNGVPKTSYFNYIFTPLRNQSGAIYAVMNTAADVTDVVMAKKEVERSAEELSELNEEMAALNEELTASNEEQYKFNTELSSLYEKLKISQDELELAIDAAALGTFDLDPQTGRFTGNDTIKDWFGLEHRDEIELEKATQVIHPEDRERVIAAIQYALTYESGGYYDTSYTIASAKDAPRIIVRAKGKTLFNEKRQPIRLSGVLQDVTEQTAYQQNLQALLSTLEKSEKKFRSLLQQAPVAINVFKTSELIIESANEKMLEIWGKDAAVDGLSFSQALPEMAEQPFIKVLKEVMTTGLPYYGVEKKAIIYKNGIAEERFFDFIYQPIHEDDGHVESILQVVTEVTEKVIARQEIADINTRLNIAIDAGGLGSTEIDIATGEMICNDQFKRCFGRPLKDNFNLEQLFDSIVVNDRERVRRLLLQAQITNGTFEAEYEVQWPDGSIHWLKGHGKARYDSEGKAVKMVGIISDITEAKADEQRKSDFIGMVSHELKTPLTSLSAYVQLLHNKLQKQGDTFATNVLEKANNQAKKMTGMINSFLNVSRLESGKIHIDKKPFDLSALVRELEDEFKVTTSTHQLIFDTKGEILVNADREKIGHVISNFISNAVKYSPVGSLITVNCYISNGSAILSVLDQGSGIEQEDQPKLFERYYRVINQPSTVSGFGIGLYICAEIIKRHDGEIWVNSGIGKGSTFYFSLPQ